MNTLSVSDLEISTIIHSQIKRPLHGNEICLIGLVSPDSVHSIEIEKTMFEVKDLFKEISTAW
jgi:hypothetical protein